MNQVILLGASNVSINFPLIVNLLRSGFDGPVHVCAAEGHGRSYGIWSNIGPRALPSIKGSALWDNLSADPANPNRKALITDIGNDLMYKVEPKHIARWVEECIQRLLSANAEILMTMLPMGSVEKLSASRYYFFRTAMFPANRFSFTDINQLINELNEEVTNLATKYNITPLVPDGDWYGIDPIHIRRGSRLAAWSHYFSHWADWQVPTAGPRRILSSFRSGRLRQQDRRWFGREQTTQQPVWQAENLQVSLL